MDAVLDPKLRRAQGRRLAEARKAAGFRSARAAAVENGWAESSYRAHETGTRTIGQDDAERYTRRFRLRGVAVSARDILFGPEEEADASGHPDRTVPIMGYIGAGAEILPEYEQVPEDGLDQVELPFVVPEDMVGFEVRGDSMLPRYDEGDVVVCFREQHHAPDSLIGEEAAVRTVDGRRFLKTIMLGARRHTFNLLSFNARPIEGVMIEWVGEIWLTVRRGQIRRIANRSRRGGRSPARNEPESS